MTETPDDIVGHKTFDTGERDKHGLPILRHEPLTRTEGEAIWQAVEKSRAERALRMPDEKAAINAMFDAYDRLRELGWSDAIYCPKDGTHFQIIENGSTGVFDCVYEGKWPDGYWTAFDDRDAYPSSKAPALYRLYPADEAKKKELMAAASAKFMAERQAECADKNGMGEK